MAEPTIKELLGQVERAGRRLEGLLRALDQVLQEAEARGETAVVRDPVLGPELPNGEGTIPTGGEVEQKGNIVDYLAGYEERKQGAGL
jgi:hypothetical protein